MPGLTIGEFLDDAKEDICSPTTSVFVERATLYRQTVASLEEGLDSDRDSLVKMKKALKTIYGGGSVRVENELYLSKSLERLGSNALNKDNETDIGAAFIKFSVVTKQLSELMKTLTQNVHNIIMFPVDNILKGDLKIKGDLKKPFEKAWRDYESKMNKIEKEKKQQAKDSNSVKNELSLSEIAEETDKERKLLQLQMCEYLIKVNEIKTKKGVELLSHLVDYHHAQTSYFQDGLKIIEEYNNYISELSNKIQSIKQKQDGERRSLLELRAMLRSCSPSAETCKDGNALNHSVHPLSGGSVDRRESKIGYSLHQIQGDKNLGEYKMGYLSKKSGGKMKVKVWQKRRCEVRDGYLNIYHSSESKNPTKLNLLTCQVKPVPDEKRGFDIVSYNRTYHFMAEDENECTIWVSVLVNSKEGALKREFEGNSAIHSSSNNSGLSRTGGPNLSQSLIELRQSVINQILKVPGNDKCVDCNSTKDPTWLSTNFGVLVCIECSGIHRELGVHISRIQSLTLDNIGTSQLLLARMMSNNGLNGVMEASLDPKRKLRPNSSMEERYDFIHAKYVDKKFILRSPDSDIDDLKNDLEQAILSRDVYLLLQVFAEGGDLNWILPSFKNEGFTSLHVAISQEDGTSLHIVDFLVQNGADLNIKSHEGNSPLHGCVQHEQSECMKLLLRCGADPCLQNHEGKTPFQLAKEKDLSFLVELLEHALSNKKSLFENVNIDWRLVSNNEDVSTDFSEDDLADDRNVTSHDAASPGLDQSHAWPSPGSPNNQSISRRFLGDNGPDRSSSFRKSLKKFSLPSWDQSSDPKYSSMPVQVFPPSLPPSSLERYPKQTIGMHGSESPTNRIGEPLLSPNKKLSSLFHHSDSIKKKAPTAPGRKLSADYEQASLKNSGSCARLARAGRLFSHARTASDTSALMQTVSQWKNVSTELETSFRNESEKGSNLRHKSLMSSSSSPFSSQRTGMPPPPLPPHQKPKLTLIQTPPSHQQSNPKRLSNGNSFNVSVGKSIDASLHSNLPVPPPRKRNDFPLNIGRLKRCQAMYDCEADMDDELAFKEGEIILILNEKTDDDDWMEGMIEGDPDRRGVFPTSFVKILPD
ncbi:arfGAP domain of ASAP isoform X2 [Brevipalpus obovatus]|uniref:arfGAP domain of ASAP isoform X2 n=1 Tax=Brevipalpus obovatus TaxID=246614 RepID=UPI003D9E6CCE